VDTLEELKSWIGFDAEDEARLRAFSPVAASHLTALADVFYARILAHPGASAVLADAAQVERLKLTLVRWSEELLAGPWDDAYRQRRERVGKRHVEVGLASRYMLAAMHTWRHGLCDLALATLPEPQGLLTCQSIGKITDIDLAIMTGTYVRRREEAQVQTLQEILVSHLPVTVLLLDADGVVTAATRADIRLFGEVRAVGRHWTQALPRALVEAGDLSSTLAHAHATGREISLPRVDVTLEGAARTFRFALVPLEHAQARSLIHIEELTDAIQTESRLQRAEALAQLGALSAAVAHELRNPLAGISGAVQVIAASMPEEDARKRVMQKVEDQIRRLDSLVGDLLGFARQPVARASDIDLAEAARAIVELARRSHPSVAFAVKGSGRASADPHLVQQVLLNLVINAANATAELHGGGGEVRIEVARGRVRVRDDGPGVPTGSEETIFQPFYTTRTRGTGLGLAICRKLALAMHGTCTLAPRVEGQGACFVLELPGSVGA
jgi:signal transduction histidine kinase